MRTVHIVVRVPPECCGLASEDINEMLREVIAESLPLGEDHGCGDESGRLSLWLHTERLERVRADAGVVRSAELIRRVIAVFGPFLKEIPANAADGTLACCIGCGTRFLATSWSSAKTGNFVYTWCLRCHAERDFRIVNGGTAVSA
jgi:hypothetical protein